MQEDLEKAYYAGAQEVLTKMVQEHGDGSGGVRMTAEQVRDLQVLLDQQLGKNQDLVAHMKRVQGRT